MNLDEAAILHALRALHDWLKGTRTRQSSLHHVTIKAGDYQSVNTLKRWYVTGTLALRSAAASPLVEDIRRLPGWLAVGLSLLLFNLPMDVPNAEDLPLVYQDIGLVFEEFRFNALPNLGEDWIKTLPRVLINNEEVKAIRRARLASDEMLVRRRLSTMELVSAEIIVRLELTRELVRAAFTIFRGEKLVQLALANVLSSARFRYRPDGVLVPVRCPSKHKGAPYGATDSFDHLLRCCPLQNKLQK